MMKKNIFIIQLVVTQKMNIKLSINLKFFDYIQLLWNIDRTVMPFRHEYNIENHFSIYMILCFFFSTLQEFIQVHVREWVNDSFHRIWKESIMLEIGPEPLSVILWSMVYGFHYLWLYIKAGYFQNIKVEFSEEDEKKTGTFTYPLIMLLILYLFTFYVCI